MFLLICSGESYLSGKFQTEMNLADVSEEPLLNVSISIIVHNKILVSIEQTFLLCNCISYHIIYNIWLIYMHLYTCSFYV